MCEWSGSEIKDLKVSLSEAGKAHRREREARLAAERLLDAYRKSYIRECNLRCELRNDLDDKKAELADMRADLARTITTLGACRESQGKMRKANSELRKALDKYRESHGKMSKANSELRKSVSDLEDTIRTLTEERDISRELFRGMVGEYADLVDRYTVKCDDYEGLASRYDVEHGEL